MAVDHSNGTSVTLDAELLLRVLHYVTD
jgi:hypothetical protein